MAQEIGVTRETVNRRLHSLQKKGLIEFGTAPRKKGQWDRRFYRLAPLDGGINPPKKRTDRVTQDHTAPCDFHQTRHRVTQDHTSRRDIRDIPDEEFIVVDRHDLPSGWVVADPKPLPDADSDEVEF